MRPDPVLVPGVPAKLDDLGHCWRHPGCRRRVRRRGGSQVDRLREDGAVAAFSPPAETMLTTRRAAPQVPATCVSGRTGELP